VNSFLPNPIKLINIFIIFYLTQRFASWVEYLGLNYTHPEWKDLDNFFIDTSLTMVKDRYKARKSQKFIYYLLSFIFEFIKSFETSHPISVEVNNPKEINYIFDAISYDKV